VRAEIAGWATGHTRSDGALTMSASTDMARVITQALRDAEIDPAEIDYVGLDAQGNADADSAELAALRTALGPHGDPLCTTVKPTTGHLLGAAAATEVAGALLAMRNGAIPPISRTTPSTAEGLHLVTGVATHRAVRTALINSRGADGTLAALVLKAA